MPTNGDKVFVVACDVRAESHNIEEQQLKLVLSTRRLLSICKQSPMIQYEATYKLIWSGYPVLLAGTSNCDRVFHPFLLVVTKGESKEDFEFIFRALLDPEWTPNILLVNGCDAITNALIFVFGEAQVCVSCVIITRRKM